ncbi:MAG: NAD(P)-dependent oxidoreductase [Polyangiaceae bacterium]|nr:NAD(P)-dependent oxidoreductase [Polyangiaceae bacterium]
MKVLVTGATGFLGRVLTPLLRDAGHSVTAVGGRTQVSPFERDIEYQSLDLLAPQALHAAFGTWRWDAVVHLAGPVAHSALDWAGERSLVTTHVRMALQVAASLPRQWDGRVLHTSSMTVYGTPESLPIEETHPRQPRHMYGLGKLLAEDVWLANAERDLWCLRLPGLFSATRRGGALFHFMQAARQGRPIRITAPEPTPWDVLDVRDAAWAIQAALGAPSTNAGALNVSYGEGVEMRVIAARILEIAGTSSNIEVEPPIMHPVFQMSIAKARTLLGWSPPSLNARLRELFAAYGES